MKYTFFVFSLFCSLSNGAVPPPIPTVVTEIVKVSELFDELSYPARVESKVNASIFSECDGVVTRIVTPLGSNVHRRGTVAVIKHTDPVYQFAPMVLISPVEGIVSQVSISEGSSVTKGQLIAAVTNPQQMRTIIEVAAADLPFMKKGLVGKLVLNGKDKDPVDVKVLGVSPFVDPTTGSATCELELDKKTKNTNIHPGLVGQVNFKVNYHKNFVLPDHAIVFKGDDTFVRIVKDGVAKKIPIVIGKKERGKVEIVSGLKEGDEVVERASGYIADGEKVKKQDKSVD